MKRRTISGIAVLLLLCSVLCGCAPSGGGQTVSKEIPVLWTETEIPTALEYDRMWIYGAHAETEDPEAIRKIVEAVRNIRVQEQEGSRAEDYTDILLFTFRDGHTCRLEFDADSWLVDDDTCLHVEGLSALRTLLVGLLENDL